MKILVAGVGGIGGWIAAALARGGADVSLLARGRALLALRTDGLVAEAQGAHESFSLPAFDTVQEGQQFDVVIISVKTPDFPVICAALAPVLKQGVEVIAAVNGLPWWFMETFEPPVRLQTIHPGGRAAHLLRETTPVGAVVHASAHAIGPGRIRVVKADRLILGDVPGRKSVHIGQLSETLARGGISAPVAGNIREEIWAKLWGNMNMNPVSALTRLSSLPILERPELRHIIHTMMEEFDEIGGKLGLVLPMSSDQRIEITKRLGDFRTSMLADAEAGRRLEHDGLLGCVVELAEHLGVDAPASGMIYALIAGLDHSFTLQA